MAEAGRELTPAEISALAERSGGNPLLARRAVREHLLGLEPSSPDHTEWIDGTPLLLAAVMVFSVLRYLGRGMHSTDLYLIGGRWRWESCACCSIPCPASRASSANDLTKGMPHA